MDLNFFDVKKAGGIFLFSCGIPFIVFCLFICVFFSFLFDNDAVNFPQCIPRICNRWGLGIRKT